MSRMTALDLVTDLKMAIGGPDPTLILDAKALRWINQSYLEVCSSYDHPSLETDTTITTSSGTADYQVASSPEVLTFTHCVDTTNQFQLLEIDCDLYGTYTQGGTQTGTPSHWYESGLGNNNRKQVTFWPTPAGTYTIVFHIKEKPADLVLTPTPTSVILHESWDDVILHFAIGRGWQLLGDFEKATLWRKQGELLAARAKQITERTPQESRRFRSVVMGALGGRG